MRDEELLRRAVLETLPNDTTDNAALIPDEVFASASVERAARSASPAVDDQLVEYDGRRLPLWQWTVESKIKRLRIEGWVKPGCPSGSWVRTWKGERELGGGE